MNQLSVTVHTTYISCTVFLLSFGGVILLCVLCCLAVVAFWISCVLSILYFIGSHVFNHSFIPRYLTSSDLFHIHVTPTLHSVIPSNIYLLPFTQQSSWKDNLCRRHGDRKTPKRLRGNAVYAFMLHISFHIHIFWPVRMQWQKCSKYLLHTLLQGIPKVWIHREFLKLKTDIITNDQIKGKTDVTCRYETPMDPDFWNTLYMIYVYIYKMRESQRKVKAK